MEETAMHLQTKNHSEATIVLPETRNQSRSGWWRYPGIGWMKWKKSKFQIHGGIRLNHLVIGFS
jgi:hypothetical protein